MSAKQIKGMKIKLNILLALTLAVYMTLLVLLSLKFDISVVSLSRIGWIEGDIRYLICYVLSTVVLLVYQANIWTKLSKQNNKLFRSLIFVGAGLIALGAAFPVGDNFPVFSNLLHSYLCQAGSVLSIVAVTIMIALYCKEIKTNTKKVAFIYGGLIVFVILAFIVLFTATLFEIGASLLFLLVMICMNSAVLHHRSVADISSKTVDIVASTNI